MRLYIVTNRYSMGIQAGIQGAHVIPELYQKYLNPAPSDDGVPLKKLQEWATDHKTIMLLRTFGGHDSVRDLYFAVRAIATRLRLPCAMFLEPELQNSATSLGIVVPSEYYETPDEELTGDLLALKEILRVYPFAS